MTSRRFFGLAARAVVAVIVLSIALPARAHAYIDPGSGSLLLQVLLAGFFAFLFMLRRVREKLKSLFKSLFGSEKNGREP
jgi:hypothetical protein